MKAWIFLESMKPAKRQVNNLWALFQEFFIIAFDPSYTLI